MGFHVEINSILRSDDYGQLTPGEILAFKKNGSRVFFDDIPVWLTKSDWTALAEIHVRNQTRKEGGLTGEFEVMFVYSGDLQQQITDMFRRMYAGGGDDHIYLLMSPDTLKAAQESGEYAPPSLKTEGFVHASPENQLNRVANKHYSQHETVHVAAARKSRIKPPVKWEPATGGLYPHVFGPFNMSAVEYTWTFQRDKDGQHQIDLQRACDAS